MARSKSSLVITHGAAQGVLGIADVDTRAITRALRTTGCLNGVITTDASLSDEDLVARTKEWSILGKDLISEVRQSGLTHLKPWNVYSLKSSTEFEG